MISWTIPFEERFLTSSAKRTSTQSTSSSRSFSKLTIATLGFSSTYTTGSTGTSYTSSSSSGRWESATTFGALGRTTSSSFSTEYATVQSKGDSFANSLTSGSNSDFTTTGGSSSFSVSGSTALPTAYVATSTTTTANSFVGTYSSEQTTNTAWTTTTETNSNSSTITRFTQTAVEATTYYGQQVAQQITSNVTTQLSQTTAYADVFKTIVQAEGNEVLFYCSNPPLFSQWQDQPSAASDFAVTGTRFTLEPSITTRQCVVHSASNRSTSTVSNAALTASTSWHQTSFTVTVGTTADYFHLPNTTRTTNEASVGTSQTSNSLSVFSANTLTFGNVDSTNGAFTNPTIATTQSVLSVASSRTTVLRQSLTTTWKTTASSSVFTTRTISDQDIATVSRGTSQTDGSQMSSSTFGQTFESASGITAEANTWSFADPWCSVTIAPTTSRTNLCKKGVFIGNNNGLWFSCASIFPVAGSLLYGMSGRKMSGLFPLSISGATIDGNTLSWTTTTNDSEATTLSMTANVAGTAKTVVDDWIVSSTNSTRALNFGGRIDENQTAIEVAGPGVYKFDSETTYFDGNATGRVGPDEAPIKKWQPLTYFDVPIFRSFYQGIAWTAARNSTALP